MVGSFLNCRQIGEDPAGLQPWAKHIVGHGVIVSCCGIPCHPRKTIFIRVELSKAIDVPCPEQTWQDEFEHDKELDPHDALHPCGVILMKHEIIGPVGVNIP